MPALARLEGDTYVRAMPAGNMPSRDALQLLLDGLQSFIREHLALARVELKQDLRTMGKDLAVSAAGAPALIAGYLLLMAAIALLLAKWLPIWAAFGLVAVVNLAAGASLTYRGARRAMSNGMDLHGTTEELQRDRQWLASMKHGNGAPASLPPGDRATTAAP